MNDDNKLDGPNFEQRAESQRDSGVSGSSTAPDPENGLKTADKAGTLAPSYNLDDLDKFASQVGRAGLWHASAGTMQGISLDGGTLAGLLRYAARAIRGLRDDVRAAEQAYELCNGHLTEAKARIVELERNVDFITTDRDLCARQAKFAICSLVGEEHFEIIEAHVKKRFEECRRAGVRFEPFRTEKEDAQALQILNLENLLDECEPAVAFVNDLANIPDSAVEGPIATSWAKAVVSYARDLNGGAFPVRPTYSDDQRVEAVRYLGPAIPAMGYDKPHKVAALVDGVAEFLGLERAK